MTTPLDAVTQEFEKLLPPKEPAPGSAGPVPTEGISVDHPPAEADADAEDSAEPAEPEGPFRRLEHAKHGYDVELTVPPDKVVDAVLVVDRNGFSLDMVSGVDWPEDEQMEVVYDFYHTGGPYRVAVRSRIPREDPEIPSISSIYAGALWHERETWEFYGIQFTGHPNLEHLLLPEDQEGYPLRKDFKADAYA